MKRSSTSFDSIQRSLPFDVLIGRAAMVGFILSFGAYLAADVVAPGVI